MIVDASAIVAMLLDESDANALLARLDDAGECGTHPVSVYEAASAVARHKATSIAHAEREVLEFLAEADIQILPIRATEASAAIAAAAIFGKGRGHPAQLNMGDCFSYAVAKCRGMLLLYKGVDFAQTDLG